MDIHKKDGDNQELGEGHSGPHEGLPDSARPHGLCPRCLKHCSFSVLGNLPFTVEQIYTAGDTALENPLERVVCLQCQNCRQGTLVVETKVAGPDRQLKWGRQATNWRGIYWWPLPSEVPPEGVPEPISALFVEAARALSGNCPRGSLALTRRVLEAVAADKGHASGGLLESLAGLASSGLLHPSLVGWAADEHFSGIRADFDPLAPASLVDARSALSFTRELLRFMYETPRMLERARTRPGGKEPKAK